jgi:alcohol dehydrogenase class IV
VRANKETCREKFIDLAQLLNHRNDLEESLLELYRELDFSPSLKAQGIPAESLKEIAFYTSRDAVNMATDPTSPSQNELLKLLERMYD